MKIQSRVQIHQIIYIAICMVIPFTMWILKSNRIHFFTFIAIGILVIIAHVSSAFKSMRNTFEVIFLFFLLAELFNIIGIRDYFPADIFLIIISLYAYLFIFKKYTRKNLFLIKGNLKGVLWVTLVCSVVSVFALSAWFYFQRDNQYAEFIPSLSLYVLIPVGIGFAIINACYEEGFFRSILLSIFSDTIGSSAAIVLQSLWFSFLHYQSGFPSGVLGIVLTFIFGVMMGYLVRRTKGVLLVVSIHSIADFVIFLLIILRMNNVI